MEESCTLRTQGPVGSEPATEGWGKGCSHRGTGIGEAWGRRVVCPEWPRWAGGHGELRPHRDLDVVPGEQPIGLFAGWGWGLCVLMGPVRGPGVREGGLRAPGIKGHRVCSLKAPNSGKGPR